MVSPEAGQFHQSPPVQSPEPSRSDALANTSRRNTISRLFAGACLITVLPLWIAGCAVPRQYSWYKPGVERSEAQQDLDECEREARVSVRQSRIPGDTSVAGSDYDILVQRSQFIESCMKAKGYRGQ
jgi:hypothetical protein